MKHYDVCILGTGPSGTLLGSILARHGIDVLLIDGEVHPRFAIGESTIPLYSRVLSFMADRYDVPELHHLSSYNKIRKHISSSSGRKRNVGFVYHRPHAAPLGSESRMLVFPEFLGSGEGHQFRQDTDMYLLTVAMKYGCTIRQGVRIGKVDINDEGVTLEVQGTGEMFKANILLDGTGARSPFATKMFDMRESPTRCAHQSRSLFTHMIGVKPFDDCVPDWNPASRWSHGTLHHVFDGGWIWVIPFNNVEGSTNPLASVGLTLDPRKFPNDGTPPGEEFRKFAKMFPAIGKQFEDAREVRNWVSTPRLQYSAKSYVRDRFVLLAHSGGFVDPLYSRGLAITALSTNALASRLIAAVRDNDFSADRFKYYETLNQQMIDGADALVNASFISWKHFPLWNAWVRLWAAGQALGEVELVQNHLDWLQKRDDSVIHDFENPKHPGMLFSSADCFKRIWDDAVRLTNEFERGERTADEVAEYILSDLRANDLGPPVAGVADSDGRNLVTLSPKDMLRGVARTFLGDMPDDLRQFHKRGIKLVAKAALTGATLS